MVCDSIHYLENGRFTKSFEKGDFHSIEDELFKRLKAEASSKIFKSI